MNRLQLTNTRLPGTTLILGRQRIALDDQRFVGNVGWRQNEQTFDAVRVVSKSVPTLTVDATYLNQVNRVFGPDSPQGRWHGDGWLGNVAWQLPIISLTTFAYVLDFEPLTRFPGLSGAQAAALNPERVSTAKVNVQLQAKVKRFTGVIKYAAYEAHEGRTPASYQDTTKLWAQLEYLW